MATTLNISLPEPLKAYVDAQAEFGDYGTPSQYIRELIVEDRDRRRRNIEERLLDSLKDEPRALELTDEQWEHGDIVGIIEEHLKIPI
jgi:antitoxin ParD1/3/4